ncbi:MAG: DUF1835 domain-containing protein [Acidobacteriota bacterium]
MKLMHVMNGDASADRLREGGAEGEILAYPELYHEGPAPAGLEGEEWRKIRARHFARRGWAGYEEFVERQRQLDERLESFSSFDEIILWFEHDLYDQLLLIRHLDWFSKQDLKNTRLSLICIDRFPGHQPFHGLGQLSPEEHASLLGRQRPVSHSQLDLGSRAWQAFRSDDPVRLKRIIQAEAPCLPFLAAALLRHLQEFPATLDGLSRNQRQILQALRPGAATPIRIFQACCGMEESPYLGDSTFFSYLDDLATATHPALAAPQGQSLKSCRHANREFLEQPLELTRHGQDLLDSRADAVELNGIDRWLGGVHLKEGGPIWRWDEKRQSLKYG